MRALSSEKKKKKEDKEEFEVSSIKYIAVSIKKGASICNCKILRMFCQKAVSRSASNSILDDFFKEMMYYFNKNFKVMVQVFNTKLKV